MGLLTVATPSLSLSQRASLRLPDPCRLPDSVYHTASGRLGRQRVWEKLPPTALLGTQEPWENRQTQTITVEESPLRVSRVCLPLSQLRSFSFVGEFFPCCCSLIHLPLVSTSFGRNIIISHLLNNVGIGRNELHRVMCINIQLLL